MSRRMILACIPVVVMVLILSQTALGVISRNTFDTSAYLSVGGRQVEVVAQIACTPGERVTVEVTLSQQSSLAIGEGRANAVCQELVNGQEFQEIPVRVIARGRETFEPGEATVGGLAIATYRGQRTDVRQWQRGPATDDPIMLQ